MATNDSPRGGYHVMVYVRGAGTYLAVDVFDWADDSRLDNISLPEHSVGPDGRRVITIERDPIVAMVKDAVQKKRENGLFADPDPFWVRRTLQGCEGFHGSLLYVHPNEFVVASKTVFLQEKDGIDNDESDSEQNSLPRLPVTFQLGKNDPQVQQVARLNDKQEIELAKLLLQELSITSGTQIEDLLESLKGRMSVQSASLFRIGQDLVGMAKVFEAIPVEWETLRMAVAAILLERNQFSTMVKAPQTPLIQSALRHWFESSRDPEMMSSLEWTICRQEISVLPTWLAMWRRKAAEFKTLTGYAYSHIPYYAIRDGPLPLLEEILLQVDGTHGRIDATSTDEYKIDKYISEMTQSEYLSDEDNRLRAQRRTLAERILAHSVANRPLSDGA